jgi:hypothetical protein
MKLTYLLALALGATLAASAYFALLDDRGGHQTEEDARYTEPGSKPARPLEAPEHPTAQDAQRARIDIPNAPEPGRAKKPPYSEEDRLLEASLQGDYGPPAWQPSQEAFRKHTTPFFEGVSEMTDVQADFYLRPQERSLILGTVGESLRMPSPSDLDRIWDMPETPARFAEYLTATWAFGSYLRRREATPLYGTPLEPWEEQFLEGLKERAQDAWISIFQADPEWELAATIGIRAEQE